MTQPALSENTTLADLNSEMRERYGLVMGYSQIQEALQFKSAVALRLAVSKKRIGFRLFRMEGRRGKYALTKDVAEWLARQVEAPVRRSA